ncbi:MAG: hypothetical protein K6E32_07520 [Lachnospiraceae bacterium]|nr:hypothetical protein [Lachnospiraceae bacterium]
MIKKFLKEKIGTIIFLVIVAALILWGTLSVKKAQSNAITFSEDWEAPESTLDLKEEGTYKSIAKSDRAELLYNEAKGSIWLKNLETGYIWKGICDMDVYDVKSGGKMWSAYMQSAITITYNDLKNRDAAPKTIYSGKDIGELTTEYIENGVSVTYGFYKPGIFVTVEYVLDGDDLVVRIPYEKIEEKSRFAITQMEILPFMGAAQNDVGGYLFYPDGAGAITTYERSSLRPSDVKAAFYYTYSNRYATYKNLYNSEMVERYTACMPVYGIKNGDNALFAAGTKNEASCGVAVYPSGYVINLNHIGFMIDLRNVFNVEANVMSTESGTTSGGILQRVDKQIIPEDREFRFFMLSGDKANYSGMADAYRSYLLETGKLNVNSEDTREMPLYLKLLSGAVKEGMVFKEYVPMTSFDEVSAITDDLMGAGIGNIDVTLTAWQQDGNYYSEYWPAAGKIGGASGLKRLSRYLADHQNVDIYLEQDTTWVYDKTKKISETKDVVYDGMGTEISLEFFNGETGYLLNPAAAEARNKALLKKLSKAPELNIAYSTLARFAYPDYNKDNSFTKNETANTYSEILKETTETGRKTAVNGCNMYSFANADYVYGIPEEAFGLSITDYSVPFVEMVLSGCVPYATDGAGNLSYDLNYQKLKWIEYGSVPYFMLTYRSALNLRESNYADLFSSTYEDWRDDVIDTFNELKDSVGFLYGKRLMSHEVLSEDTVKITYEDGTKIYINYDRKSAVCEGITVPAESYAVVKGGD